MDCIALSNQIVFVNKYSFIISILPTQQQIHAHQNDFIIYTYLHLFITKQSRMLI